MIENYMDFTNDVCMNLFTNDQKGRIRIVMDNSPRRNSLINSPGLIPPVLGIDLGIKEVLEPTLVNCDNRIIPTVEVANFGTDPVTGFQLSYDMDGAAPVTFNYTGPVLVSGESVIVAFSEINLDNSRHTFHTSISNVAGGDENPTNDDVTQLAFISLDEDIIPLREEFGSDEFENGWFVINFDNNLTWEVETAGNPGPSAGVNHFNNAFVGEENWLVGPILDFSGTSEASMFFDVSYARNGNRNDGLRVLLSTNCGESFDNILYEKFGSELSVTSSAQSWTPDGAEDWRREFIDLTTYAGMEEVRIAFVAINDFGNNLYVDNIEFFLSNDEDPIETPENNFILYPNPTFDEVNMVINLSERETIVVEVIDATGHLLFEKEFPNTLNQTYIYSFGQLPAGLYLVRARGRTINTTERIIKFR
jgi:type IX secretion system substrate protein